MLPEGLVQDGWSSLQPVNKQHSSPAAVSPEQSHANSSFLPNEQNVAQLDYTSITFKTIGNWRGILER